MREYFFKFTRFWLLQALTVWVVMLAVLYGFRQESTADAQKSKFGANKANKGKWIDSGVWAATANKKYKKEVPSVLPSLASIKRASQK